MLTAVTVTGLGFKPKYVSFMAAKNSSSVTMGTANVLVCVEQGTLAGTELFNQAIAYKSSGLIYGSTNTTRCVEIGFNDDGFSIAISGGMSIDMLATTYSYVAIG